MNSLANHLDWVALLVGAVGSFLWAHNGRWSKHASAWWLVSSLLWIVFAWLNGMPALGVRDVLGIAAAAYGCYRWRQPRDTVTVPVTRDGKARLAAGET